MKSVAAALVVLGVSAIASAKVVVYSAKPGDTPESIAADYYGNRSQAIFIIETNGLERDKPLKPGQKVRIPTAFHYRVHKGDTLEGLAQKFLDDKRRSPFLAAFSGLRPTDKLREGQDLLIPFQHVHRTEVPESLQSVARVVLRRRVEGEAARRLQLPLGADAGQGRARAGADRRTCTFARCGCLPVNEKPVVGSKQKEMPAAPVLAPAPPKEAQKREAELAEKVGKSLAIAEKAYKDGSYSDVPSVLDKVLTEDEPSESQLAELFRLKAFAYVALGLDELAVNAFREVLARKPDVALDEATVSPKIRAALERAKKTPGP